MKFKPIVMERGDTRFRMHARRLDAEIEAVRLASISPGKEFCVYVPVAIYGIPPAAVKKTPIEEAEADDLDIPF